LKKVIFIVGLIGIFSISAYSDTKTSYEDTIKRYSEDKLLIELGELYEVVSLMMKFEEERNAKEYLNKLSVILKSLDEFEKKKYTHIPPEDKIKKKMQSVLDIEKDALMLKCEYGFAIFTGDAKLKLRNECIRQANDFDKREEVLQQYK